MNTTLTVGVTAYQGADRAGLGMVGIDQLTLSCDNYWELAFTILGCGPTGPFSPGMPVNLAVDQGSGPVLVFSGDIVGPCNAAMPAESGWSFSYRCLDLKRRADHVTLLAWDGTSTAAYNLPPDVLDYDSSRAGKNVGQIVTEILQVYATAVALTALGVGNYTFGTDSHGNPTATISATTATDLALLTLVPQYGVRLEGETILNVLEGFIASHHPQYCMWVQADGTIRVASPFGFTPFNLTLPGASVAGDPVDGLDYHVNTENAYTRYQVVGRDLTGTILSVKDGTLTPVNTSTDRANWTLYDYLQPKGYSDQGTISITSSTSATVTSDDITMTWAAGFWEANSGVLVAVNTSGAGLAITERRPIKLSAAMAAGGTADVEWDSSLPLDEATYNRYYLVATNNPLAFVDRLFWVTDPSSGDTGLDTTVGASMTNRDPNGIPWGNNTQGGLVFYPAARVLWSLHGDAAVVAARFPMLELPAAVKLLRNSGQVLLGEPACFTAAQAAGSYQGLALGYPSTAFGGLWEDIQVAVPYSRGPLVASSPGSGYTGTAYTACGIARPKTLMLDSYTSRGQDAAMVALAGERVATTSNAEVEGQIGHHGIPSGFSPFGVGFGLTLTVGGSSGPLDGVFLPVRSTTIRWPNSSSDIYTCTFAFSNRRAPCAADSRYLRPELTHDHSSNEVTFDAGGPPVMDDARHGHPGRQERERAKTRPEERPGFVGPPTRLEDAENRRVRTRSQTPRLPDPARMPKSSTPEQDEQSGRFDRGPGWNTDTPDNFGGGD